MKRGVFFICSLVSCFTQSYPHVSTRVAFECHTVISSAKRFCPTAQRIICKAASLLTLTSDCPCFPSQIFRVALCWEALYLQCTFPVRRSDSKRGLRAVGESLFARLSCTHIPNPLGAQKAITVGADLRNTFLHFFIIDLPSHLLCNSMPCRCIRKFAFVSYHKNAATVYLLLFIKRSS